MRILIVGAAGQLGRCLTSALEAHRLDALDRGALDITSLGQVREAVARYRPDLIINAAAFNDVDGAETRTDEAYTVNALGPRNLAVAAAARQVALMHVSTDYVFDGAKTLPYHEFDRVNPLSAYGASKLAGEEAVRTLNSRHYIVRTAWLFWENGKNFLLSMYRNASAPMLRAACDQFGSPTYAPHLAEAIARLATTEAFGTYHMAGGGGATRYDLVTELFRVLKIGAAVRPVPSNVFTSAARRPAYSALTTVQNPRIELPSWQEGVAEFARRIERAGRTQAIAHNG